MGAQNRRIDKQLVFIVTLISCDVVRGNSAFSILHWDGGRGQEAFFQIERVGSCDEGGYRVDSNYRHLHPVRITINVYDERFGSIY